MWTLTPINVITFWLIVSLLLINTVLYICVNCFWRLPNWWERLQVIPVTVCHSYNYFMGTYKVYFMFPMLTYWYQHDIDSVWKLHLLSLHSIGCVITVVFINTASLHKLLSWQSTVANCFHTIDCNCYEKIKPSDHARYRVQFWKFEIWNSNLSCYLSLSFTLFFIIIIDETNLA